MRPKLPSRMYLPKIIELIETCTLYDNLIKLYVWAYDINQEKRRRLILVALPAYQSDHLLATRFITKIRLTIAEFYYTNFI